MKRVVVHVSRVNRENGVYDAEAQKQKQKWLYSEVVILMKKV